MVRAGADFSAMRTEMQRAQQNIAAFKNKVNSTLKGIATMVAAFGIGKAIKDSLDFYDYLSMQENKLAVIMRQRMGATDEVTNSIKKFISAQEALGVVGVEVQTAGAQELATYLELSDSLKTLIPVMNDMVVQQFGFKASGEQAVSIATMMGKVMDGQVGALSRYGYTFDKAQEKILKFGEEQQRAALLAEIVRDSLGNMNQEMANTPQGRAAQLANEFAGLKYEIGVTASIFRDILMPVLSKVISFASAVAVRLQQVGLFFNALFGKSSKSATVSQAKATGQQTAAVGGLGSALDKTGKKAKKAGQEMKKAQGSLAGFDEINSLAKQSDSGGSKADTAAGAGGGVDTGGVPDMTPIDFSTNAPDISKKVQEMANKVREVIQKIVGFIKQNKEIIVSVVGGILAGIASFLVISNWASIVSGFTTAIEAIGLAFAGISWPIVAIAAVIALLVGSIIYLWQTNEGFRNSVLEIWQQIKDFCTKVVSDMWAIVKSVWDKYGSDIVKNVKGFMKSIQDIILMLWNNWINPIMTSSLKALRDLWDNHLKGLVKQIMEFVAKFVNAVLEIWNKAIQPWINQMKVLGDVFSFIFGAVIKTVGSAVGGIVDATKGIIKALGGVIDFVSGVFTGNWSKAWQGVKDIFGGIFGGLWALIKIPLNNIIDGVNALISGLNKIKLPEMNIPGFGKVGGWGINIPRIPRLAKGGYIGANSPVMAMIGDNRNEGEIVAPESKIYEQTYAAIKDALSQGGGGNTELVINLGGTTVFRKLIDGINQAQRQAGKTLIEV